MKVNFYQVALLLALFLNGVVNGQMKSAVNPVIWADVPDMSMIRVGDKYYMSSTTMHMSPGVPIMKSKDVVNWEIVNYAYNILDDVDAMNLENGKSTYGKGSWASCDFINLADTARFYYSLDGISWKLFGSRLKMEYSMPHFMGYRFGLFNYATKSPGGHVDFDYFDIGTR